MKRQRPVPQDDQIIQANKSGFSYINFMMKSSMLAMMLTILPITSLVVIWELGITTTLIMVLWVMFALFWTFYIILKAPEKFIK